jgi:hypothetical protein
MMSAKIYEFICKDPQALRAEVRALLAVCDRLNQQIFKETAPLKKRGGQ